MPLDFTPGGASADSYCTLQEAESYFASRGGAAEWADASSTTDVKERHLRWAARHMDGLFSWVGAKATREQARAWPRRCVVDADGFDVPSTEVPRAVKDAQAELALMLLRDPAWAEGLGAVVDDGVQVGPLRTSRERHRPVPATVAVLLRGLTLGSEGSGVRSVELVRG